PDGHGKLYPQLAQHALREAKVLARNVARAGAAQKAGGELPTLEDFKDKTLGRLAAVGHYNGVGKVMEARRKGVVAWWVWQQDELMQMARWNRRVRIVLDWTSSLMFKNDVVKLDFEKENGA